MRLRHDGDVLAAEVDVADTTFARARGLMFRRSIPDGYALVFRFRDVGRRDVHMLFVPFPLDVVWLADGAVERVETLRPWIGLASARADLLVELPAGAASDVEVGDSITIETAPTDPGPDAAASIDDETATSGVK